MQEIIQKLREFADERDWQQFHTPENLAKSIMIEAAELLEHFQWDGNFDSDEVKKELADVMNYCVMLADKLGIDPVENMAEKIKENELKYPVEKAKGNSKKYTEYE